MKYCSIPRKSVSVYNSLPLPLRNKQAKNPTLYSDMASPGTHLVKTHESQFKKPIRPWVFCNRTDNLKIDSKTLYYSYLDKNILLLLYSTTKTKRNKRRLTAAARTAAEITKKGYSTKNFFRSINRSLRSTERMPQIILRLRGFLCVRDAGHSGNKITLL